MLNRTGSGNLARKSHTIARDVNTQSIGISVKLTSDAIATIAGLGYFDGYQGA